MEILWLISIPVIKRPLQDSSSHGHAYNDMPNETLSTTGPEEITAALAAFKLEETDDLEAMTRKCAS